LVVTAILIILTIPGDTRRKTPEELEEEKKRRDAESDAPDNVPIGDPVPEPNSEEPVRECEDEECPAEHTEGEDEQEEEADDKTIKAEDETTTEEAPPKEDQQTTDTESTREGEPGKDTESDTRQQALNEAKKQNKIPTSAEPDRVIKPGTPQGDAAGLRRDENKVLYEYTNREGEKIHIREDMATTYPDGGTQDPHFNSGPAGKKLKLHHYFKK
jgi:hypothetical protein